MDKQRHEAKLEELTKPLQEIKKKCPELKVYKSEPVGYGLKGKLNYMEHGAVILYELGKLLWPNGKKFRVTIECDPEAGRFEAKRMDIT